GIVECRAHLAGRAALRTDEPWPRSLARHVAAGFPPVAPGAGQVRGHRADLLYGPGRSAGAIILRRWRGSRKRGLVMAGYSHAPGARAEKSLVLVGAVSRLGRW